MIRYNINGTPTEERISEYQAELAKMNNYALVDEFMYSMRSGHSRAKSGTEIILIRNEILRRMTD